VNAAGDITLPFIGVVHVAGLTPTEVETIIVRRLVAAGILVHPQVSVQIAEHRHQVVAVVGSVERPGLYPLTRPGATLADMMWAAGGPSKEAGRLVDFTPASDAGRPGSAIRIDLDLLMKAMSAGPGPVNPIADPGDVLAIAPAGSVLVDGWVDKPGSYPVTRGLTLTGAVAAAGGHLFPADRAHVSVKRVVSPGEQRFFTVDLDDVAGGREPDFPLTDGDVVNLPMSAVRVVPWSLWTVAREMIHIGGSALLF
jgi:polysaccharide export outer membrane protein